MQPLQSRHRVFPMRCTIMRSTLRSFNAHNLWNFDFFKSFGLADVVASAAPAAHSVVHTHQGDFPRVFTFILHAIGARSVESQIWITTSTIGFGLGRCSVSYLKS